MPPLAGVPALLEEARSRSRTLYFPHTSAPMFPRVLAEGPFSLREGEECCALSVGATLRPDGSIGDVQVQGRGQVDRSTCNGQQQQLMFAHT
jgi:exoribonuclease II